MIFGYARSKFNINEFRNKIKPHLKGDDELVDHFLQHVNYIRGKYECDSGDYQKLKKAIESFENDVDESDACKKTVIYY